jgi:hypothetical protein
MGWQERDWQSQAQGPIRLESEFMERPVYTGPVHNERRWEGSNPRDDSQPGSHREFMSRENEFRGQSMLGGTDRSWPGSQPGTQGWEVPRDMDYPDRDPLQSIDPQTFKGCTEDQLQRVLYLDQQVQKSGTLKGDIYTGKHISGIPGLQKTVLPYFSGETKYVDMKLPEGFPQYTGQNVVDWLNSLYEYARQEGVSYATLNMNMVSKGSRLFVPPYRATVERFVDRMLDTRKHLAFYFTRYHSCPRLQAWGSFRLRLDMVHLFQAKSIDTPQQIHFRIQRKIIDEMVLPAGENGKFPLSTLHSVLDELMTHHEGLYDELDEAQFEMDLHAILKRSDKTQGLFQRFMVAYANRASEARLAQTSMRGGVVSKLDMLRSVADKLMEETMLEEIRVSSSDKDMETRLRMMQQKVDDIQGSSQDLQKAIDRRVQEVMNGYVVEQMKQARRQKDRARQRDRAQSRPVTAHSSAAVVDMSSEDDTNMQLVWQQPESEDVHIYYDEDYLSQYTETVNINALQVQEQIQRDPTMVEVKPCVCCANPTHSFSNCTVLWQPRNQPATLSTHKLGFLKRLDEACFEMVWKRIKEQGLLKGATESEVQTHLELIDQHAKVLEEQDIQRRETQQANSRSYGGQQGMQRQTSMPGRGYGNGGYGGARAGGGGYGHGGYGQSQFGSGAFTAPHPSLRR